MQKILGMNDWKYRVRDLFSMQRICKWDHTKTLEETTKIHDELNRKHGTRRVYSAYIAGYVKGLMDSEGDTTWSQYLEFCYVVDGVIYSTAKDTKRLTTRHYCDKVNPENGGRVLCDSQGLMYWRGSDKVFF